MQIADHNGAMDIIDRASSVTTLSYDEAIAIYLRSRGILRDEFVGSAGKPLGAPVPRDWQPPQRS